MRHVLSYHSSLTMALLLGLFGGQTDLIPVIVIGAVTGFIISKAFTPLLQKHTAQPVAAVNNDNHNSCIPRIVYS